MIAVAMSENTMLTIDKETTSSSQRPSPHLEELYGRIRREYEVLISSNEHKDNDEGSPDDHPVR